MSWWAWIKQLHSPVFAKSTCNFQSMEGIWSIRLKSWNVFCLYISLEGMWQWPATSLRRIWIYIMYVLFGKFNSNPIKRRFVWCSQTKWWQLVYVNSAAILSWKKKIRCLGLLRQNALHTLAHLNTSPTNSTEDDMDAFDCLEEISFFKK